MDSMHIRIMQEDGSLKRNIKKLGRKNNILNRTFPQTQPFI